MRIINSDSDQLGSDMYFSTSAKPNDMDEQNFLAALLTAVEFFKEGESNYVN